MARKKIPGMIGGLGITLKTMLKPAVTVQYPHEKEDPVPRARGVIALKEENCTVCMLCARQCPDWCIYIEGHKEKRPPRREGGRDAGAARTALDADVRRRHLRDPRRQAPATGGRKLRRRRPPATLGSNHDRSSPHLRRARPPASSPPLVGCYTRAVHERLFRRSRTSRQDKPHAIFASWLAIKCWSSHPTRDCTQKMAVPRGTSCDGKENSTLGNQQAPFVCWL